MSDLKTTGPVKKKNLLRKVAKVMLFTIIRLKPARQTEIPALFLFWFATVVLTLVSFYLWIFHGFHKVPLQSLLTLWILILFLNFCESFIETGNEDKDSDEFHSRKKY